MMAVHQRCQRSGVGDVLHQDAQARLAETFVDELRQRHAQYGDVVATQAAFPRPGGVVDQESAGADLRQVLGVGLGVHRDHDVDPAGAGHVSAPVGANFIPGGQSLDVGWKHVLAGYRDAHPEQGFHDQAVGAGRAGAVDRGDLQDEVVYPAFRR
jgi:hypothetical protein